MRTIDMFNKPTAKKLNESFGKTYGQKMNLESFTLPQLEDARNRLRTQQHTMKSDANFNETVESEAHVKTQWMLDIINQEISDRTEVAMEESDPASMFQGIETEEVSVDEGRSELESIIAANKEAVMSFIAGGDMDYDLESDLHGYYYDQLSGQAQRDSDDDGEISQLFAEDLKDMGLMDDDNEPSGSYDSSDDADALASAGHGSDEDYGIYDSYDFETGQPVQENKQTKGSNMTRINESELNKASAVVSAKSMVDKVGRWIEELSGMENDTLLTLGDSIRDEMGQESAKAFLSSVAPAIQQSLDALKQTRETMASGVRGLTGEEQPEEMLGAPAPDMEPEMEPAPDDTMNPDSEVPDEFAAPEDDFAAAEPAIGGAETAGREQRESIDRSSRLMKVLAG